jgi:hypothetical protein
MSTPALGAPSLVLAPNSSSAEGEKKPCWVMTKLREFAMNPYFMGLLFFLVILIACLLFVCKKKMIGAGLSSDTSPINGTIKYLLTNTPKL